MTTSTRPLEARMVLDASTAVTWCLGVAASATRAEQAIDSRRGGGFAHVACIWPLEVTSGLLQAVHQKVIKKKDLEGCVSRVRAIPVQLDSLDHPTVFDELLPLAIAHQLTPYDACYLHLALRTGLPLSTFDKGLRRAAGDAGVALL